MTKEELKDLWIAMCSSKKTVKGGSYGSGPFYRKTKLPGMVELTCSEFGNSVDISGLGFSHSLTHEEFLPLKQAWENKQNGTGYTVEEIKALL